MASCHGVPEQGYGLRSLDLLFVQRNPLSPVFADVRKLCHDCAGFVTGWGLVTDRGAETPLFRWHGGRNTALAAQTRAAQSGRGGRPVQRGGQCLMTIERRCQYADKTITGRGGVDRGNLARRNRADTAGGRDLQSLTAEGTDDCNSETMVAVGRQHGRRNATYAGEPGTLRFVDHQNIDRAESGLRQRRGGGEVEDNSCPLRAGATRPNAAVSSAGTSICSTTVASGTEQPVFDLVGSCRANRFAPEPTAIALLPDGSTAIAAQPVLAVVSMTRVRSTFASARNNGSEPGGQVYRVRPRRP